MINISSGWAIEVALRRWPQQPGSVMPVAMFCQEKKICDSAGRDCIERNARLTFNCNVTCGGIYADAQWSEVVKEELVEQELEMDEEVGEEVAKMVKDLKRGMELMKGRRGDELEKNKYMKLVSEYEKFKKNNVQHFKFSSASNRTAFGQF